MINVSKWLPFNGGSGVKLGVFIFLIQIGLYINAELVFGAQATLAQQVLTIYLVMEALALAAFQSKMPTLKMDIKGIITFFFGFGLTAFAVIIIPGLVGFSSAFDPIVVGLLFGLIFAFVKAFIEEAIFRDILPTKAGLGHILSNVFFAIFHASMLIFTSYQLFGFISPSVVIGGTITLFILGMIWSFMKERVDIMFATGSHLAWNVAALGLLPALLVGI